MLGIKLPNLLSGALTRIIYNTNTEQADQPILLVEGRQTGLVAWILGLVGLVDNTFTFTIDRSFIGMGRGATNFEFFPASEIHSVTVGYTMNKLWLVMTAGFALAALGTLVSGQIVATLLAVALTALTFFFYSKSGRLEFSVRNINPDRNATVLGVRLSSSLNGPNVSPELLRTISGGLRELAITQSKYYR